MEWLWKIYHTKGFRTFGEMVSYAGDSHIPVIMVCDTESPYAGKAVSHTVGPHFHERDPHISGKMGTWSPHLRGPYFYMTPAS